MKIIGVSFFWGMAATIILSVTLFSIAIYDTAYHRIHNIICIYIDMYIKGMCSNAP